MRRIAQGRQELRDELLDRKVRQPDAIILKPQTTQMNKNDRELESKVARNEHTNIPDSALPPLLFDPVSATAYLNRHAPLQSTTYNLVNTFNFKLYSHTGVSHWRQYHLSRPFSRVHKCINYLNNPSDYRMHLFTRHRQLEYTSPVLAQHTSPAIQY